MRNAIDSVAASKRVRPFDAAPGNTLPAVSELREGERFKGRALVLPDRHLRITQRCLSDDLGSDGASFVDVQEQPIIKAFIRERREKWEGSHFVGSRDASPRISVLRHQHRHRGGTWHDDTHDVVWLVAYGRHQSGAEDDFFPYCKGLQEAGVLLPTKEDYEALFRDQSLRLAQRLMVEPPLLLKRARESGQEERAVIGGKFGTTVAVEFADDLESITVAFDATELEVYEYVAALLAAFVPDGEWEDARKMPSRDLEEHEIAFTHTGLK